MTHHLCHTKIYISHREKNTLSHSPTSTTNKNFIEQFSPYLRQNTERQPKIRCTTTHQPLQYIVDPCSHPGGITLRKRPSASVGARFILARSPQRAMHPSPRATIKALPVTPHHPRPYGSSGLLSVSIASGDAYIPIKNKPRAIASPANVHTTTRYNIPVAD